MTRPKRPLAIRVGVVGGLAADGRVGAWSTGDGPVVEEGPTVEVGRGPNGPA